MKGRFLLGSKNPSLGGNIYADKSSLVLDWLLRVGINRERFSLREVSKEIGVSIGLVQRVFKVLVSNGILHTEGVRTAKKFSLKKPEVLIKSWLDHYSIVKKCKMWTYRSRLQNKEELLKALKKADLFEKTALALHSATDVYGCKNTNLETLELYILDPTIKSKLEQILQLEPQEKGYEVLLIEPYYKTLLDRSFYQNEKGRASPALLTYLDLYHFPLRGQEQAEFMAERLPELKQIYKRDKS